VTAERTVSTVEQLMAVAGDPAVRRIAVRGTIAGAASLLLAPGQQLVGEGAEVVFADRVDGVRLSRDNEVAGIGLRVSPARRAVYNNPDVADLGTLRLARLVVFGQVQILARQRVRGGHVAVDGVDVVAADVRERAERPVLSGVGALQGAFTLWSLQTTTGVVLTAELRGLSAGRAGAPVRGSGVLVGGAGGDGGRLEVRELETGLVVTDGGIPEGSHDTISGGVFVVQGAHVVEVHNRGAVTTHGVHDMVLDNWGAVDRWTASAPLTSYGRSGVGFVNFGSIGQLRIDAPIETYGVGARGFNVYHLDDFAGPTVSTAEFDRISTHADAAVGIQVGQPVGRLIIHSGIHTHGGAGDSLVKGVLTRLSANALSVQPGGRIDSVEVGGALTSAGPEVVTVDIGGEVGRMHVAGGIHANGPRSDALHVGADGVIELRDTKVTAQDGVAVRLARDSSADLRDVTVNGARGDIITGRDPDTTPS
jgi:hypothetical protein